jgi:hypothetical protein
MLRTLAALGNTSQTSPDKTWRQASPRLSPSQRVSLPSSRLQQTPDLDRTSSIHPSLSLSPRRIALHCAGKERTISQSSAASHGDALASPPFHHRLSLYFKSHYCCVVSSLRHC